MTGLKGSGVSWPGFSYEDREWSRLEVLAAAVDGMEGVWFVTVYAVVFIAIAAVAMFAFVFFGVWLLDARFGPISPLAVELLLGAVMVFVLGFGFPAAMRIAARLVATERLRGTLRAASEDAALWRKVRRQMRRMMALACGLAVPFLVLCASFGLDPSPLLTVVRVVCGGAVIAAVLLVWKHRGERSP